MRKKTLTFDCTKCNKCTVDDDSNYLCHWGKGKPKRMFSPKGKMPLPCTLKRS